MTSILVTDGRERAALAIVRSLGRAGHDVYVCSPQRRSLAGSSRYARGSVQCPDPLADGDGYIDFLEHFTAERDVEMMLPVTDASLLAVMPVCQRFSNVLIPFPPLEAYLAVSDKKRVVEMADQVGIATPRQVVFEDIDAARTGEIADLSFPVALKPSRSVVEVGAVREKVIVRYAADRADFKKRIEGYPPSAFPLLVQELIEGPGVGVFLLLWEGEVRAAFAHQRIREKPPWGGPSVYREGIALDSGLLAKSRALMDAFGWQGVCMVEYKVNRRTNVPYLMEVNGRFWGSLQLAIDCGVDFPLLLVDAASGRVTNPVMTYHTGVRSRWLWGDIDQLLMQIRGRRSDMWTPGKVNAWRAIRSFGALPSGKDKLEILRLRDPRPFVRETIDWFRRQ